MPTKRSDLNGGTLKTTFGNLFLPLIITVYGLLFTVYAAPAAYGQTTSLSIWPPLLEVTIKPGTAITQVYRLKNMGDDTNITARIVPFRPADELGHVEVLPNEVSPTVSYFSLQNADLDLPARFALAAGATQELVLKIRVPETAADADHSLTFLFDSDTEGLIGGSGSLSRAAIGANILLTVSRDGQPVRNAKIEEFRPSRRVLEGSLRGLSLLDSFDPIGFTLRVKNTSQTKLKAVGSITVTNMFGQSSAVLPLREDNILAGSTRSLTSLEHTRCERNLHTGCVVGWNPLFPLGLYSATAQITPADTTNTVSATIKFLVLPYKALLALFLIINFYLFGRNFMRKSSLTEFFKKK
ncbi:MAG: hypothetical protein UX85_C0004G0020 [Candidatus Beckwithbacteria bacterium GW2011_GWB1_47_15]|uniref:DUF916 domain-containing protein n=1 Tax=Candidatus Beckwithbacteria bacterium GW2011_GWB1_47_15 TaxID=1618371 RepID=A0A0G1RUZ5_9BACT|nr:MAG: Uncharacterized protein UY43_C0001G0229 [Candidatus Beckwithbacteria bacterium GW2011_GWC1_49_16]KKU35424.1 MAG: hypothetical protein UX50_C0003G0020 [Candidatus Beckwithbacteria bacterium GW2011_GWA1_46_30]KKU61099.1 MAG: hypothetical protein UX85_C0004G0020 [Candidatus Beckwithbacteria bacterium GW2011_GWB1_47_15]KKU71938.1 MAG: hypothetical protein UX97_C0002G0020 [Candidatus Beckwithbacteria bacterium GW2011_GWA2_47_25]KKW02953.1 MAG: hypothetical protein UY37_C0009G0027 [Candidatus